MGHTSDKGFALSPGLLGFSRSASTLNWHCTTWIQPVNSQIWLYNLTVLINKRHSKAAFTPTKTHQVFRKSDTETTQRTTGQLTNDLLWCEYVFQQGSIFLLWHSWKMIKAMSLCSAFLILSHCLITSCHGSLVKSRFVFLGGELRAISLTNVN